MEDNTRFLGLVDAVELVVGGGYRPNLQTVLRWANRGVAGQKLQTVYIGGRRMTTTQWAKQFFDAVNLAKSAKLRGERLSEEHEAAKARLAEIYAPKRRKAAGAVQESTPVDPSRS
jgi:hypothetical protein